MANVLAIDLGTSGLKVALVDASGRVIRSSSARLPTTYLPDGGAEQDAEGWWQAVGGCAREITDGVEVAAVAVTSQYMSIVAVDGAGLPLAPAIMWMDSRGAKHHRIARQPGVAELFLDRHGMVPMGYDDQGHIAYLREERPDVYAAAAAFVEPVDYLNARLTGRIVATQTTAMPLMTVDNRAHGATEHDPELVAASGIPFERLPKIVTFDELVGPVTTSAAAHLGVTTGAVVVTGTVDSITSGIGCGVIDGAHCSVIFGTTSVIVTNVGAKVADHEHGLVSMPSPLPGSYFVLAENGVGGRALEHWLGIIDASYDDGERVAATSPVGSNGVRYQPWLSGSLAPATDIRTRGGFLNLGLETSRADMTRAVYEGVALNAAWLLPHVAALAGASWPAIRFGGGGARSALWSQLLADATGTRVEQLADPSMTNARGAALLALTQIGKIAVADIPSMIEISHTYEPDPGAHATYRSGVEQLADLHERLRPWYRSINR